ncbi:MAG: helix-turn-helix domain-containing protein [Magnetococcales bacterium]|nr:helix-turn-helix domain-containing protein [Magnetococcales bacterium]
MKFVEAVGGTRVFIPKNMKAQHRLANLLGIEQARKLSLNFGGETLTVARAAELQRKVRNREIIRRYNEGANVRELARENNLTERQIYAILSKVP